MATKKLVKETEETRELYTLYLENKGKLDAWGEEYMEALREQAELLDAAHGECGRNEERREMAGGAVEAYRSNIKRILRRYARALVLANAEALDGRNARHKRTQELVGQLSGNGIGVSCGVDYSAHVNAFAYDTFPVITGGVSFWSNRWNRECISALDADGNPFIDGETEQIYSTQEIEEALRKAEEVLERVREEAIAYAARTDAMLDELKPISTSSIFANILSIRDNMHLAS